MLPRPSRGPATAVGYRRGCEGGAGGSGICRPERCRRRQLFDPRPPGAGRYLLSAILHNWDDDAARAILRHCAEAADQNGAVFVVEKIGADGETVYT